MIDNHLFVCGRSYSTRGRARVWEWDGVAFTSILNRYVYPKNAFATACDVFFGNGNLYVSGAGTSSSDTEGFILAYDGSSWTEEWVGGGNTEVSDIIEFNGDMYAMRMHGDYTAAVYKRDGGSWNQVLDCAQNNNSTIAGYLFKDTVGSTEYLLCVPYNTTTANHRCYYTTDGSAWTGLGDFGHAGWSNVSYLFYDNFVGVWRARFKGNTNERTNATLAPVVWAGAGNPGHLGAGDCFGDFCKTSSNEVYIGIDPEDHYRKYDVGGWADDYSFAPSTLDIISYRKSAFANWLGVDYGVVNDGTARLMKLTGGAWAQVYSNGSIDFSGVAASYKPFTCVYDGTIAGTYTIEIDIHA